MCDKLDKIAELTKKICCQMEFVDMLTMAIDESSEGLAILDKDYQYIFLNKAHEKMFGYEDDELVGKSWKNLYNDKQIKYFESAVFPVVHEEGKWNGKEIGIKKDGTLIKQHVYLTELPNGGLICISIKL